jgi:hypothetical protein
MARRIFKSICILVAASWMGCIERTVSINTEPTGATVILNDDEVGKSPVKVPFTWYGDYDIIIRKPGYKTLKTNHRLNAPWYQFPIIDIFAECLVPYTIHDDRVMPTFALDAETPTDRKTLLENASNLRQEALGG